MCTLARSFRAIGLVTAALGALSSPTRAQNTAQEADSVYAVAIRFLFFSDVAVALSGDATGPSMLVVADSTDLRMGLDDTNGDTARLMFRFRFPTARAALIDAFLNVNRARTATRLPRLQVPVRILARASFDSLFTHTVRRGWEQFWAQYPHAQGMMTVSQVAFDPEGQQALVYIGNSRGSLAGEGLILLLERTPAGWRVLANQTTWVS
jgi:hypothetical protein